MPEFDLSFIWSATLFVNLALLFYVLGFLARDEMWLRGWLLLGTVFYLIYYYYAADAPLWDAMFTSGVLGLTNTSMMVVIAIERSTWFLSADQAVLYRSFRTLSPGQFRKLLALAKSEKLSEPRLLTIQDVTSRHLTFVSSGSVSIQRAGEHALLAGPSFIGEVGFLLDRPASATVQAGPGAEILQWDAGQIRELMTKKPEISNAMVALFNVDMALKVSRSMPVHATPLAGPNEA